MMDVDLIFKIAAIGILVSVLNQVLTRSGRDEMATMTTLVALVVVLMIVVQQINDLFTLVKDLFLQLTAIRWWTRSDISSGATNTLRRS